MMEEAKYFYLMRFVVMVIFLYTSRCKFTMMCTVHVLDNLQYAFL